MRIIISGCSLGSPASPQVSCSAWPTSKFFVSIHERAAKVLSGSFRLPSQTSNDVERRIAVIFFFFFDEHHPYEGEPAAVTRLERTTYMRSCHGVFTEFVYFQNDFGANLEYLSGPINRSVQAKPLKIAFLLSEWAGIR